MSQLHKFPKGKIKRNKHFYGWIFVAVLVIFFGVEIVITQEFSFKESPPITGTFAVYIGLFFIAFSAYFIFYLFFIAEKEEKRHHEYHVLEDFKDVIDGYNIKFSILNSSVAFGNTARQAYYYILEIEFNKNLLANLHIKQRDSLETFLWRIGLTRFLDTLTGNYYFDSKYKVTCYNKERFFNIFTPEVIKLLELFDKDYPPIRAKNGILQIEDTFLKYYEGPYIEEFRIFDPHRGVVEKLFKVLTQIISAIENNIPLLPNEEYETKMIATVREQEKDRKAKRKEKLSVYSDVYTYVTYAMIIAVLFIALITKI
jgi:hypothetical protein